MWRVGGGGGNWTVQLRVKLMKCIFGITKSLKYWRSVKTRMGVFKTFRKNLEKKVIVSQKRGTGVWQCLYCCCCYCIKYISSRGKIQVHFYHKGRKNLSIYNPKYCLMYYINIYFIIFAQVCDSLCLFFPLSWTFPFLVGIVNLSNISK